MTSITELRDLLREVASSAVEYDEPRIRYVTVQIGRDTWEHIQTLEPLHYGPLAYHSACGRFDVRTTSDWQLVTCVDCCKMQP